MMEYFVEFGYLGLFVSAFLAATILPLSSEVVLTVLLLTGLPQANLVIVATTGNVLGSLLNYLFGYWASLEVIKKNYVFLIRVILMRKTDFKNTAFGRYVWLGFR